MFSSIPAFNINISGSRDSVVATVLWLSSKLWITHKQTPRHEQQNIRRRGAISLPATGLPELKPLFSTHFHGTQQHKPPKPAVSPHTGLISDPLHHERIAWPYNKRSQNAPGQRASVRCNVHWFRCFSLWKSSLLGTVSRQGLWETLIGNTECSISSYRGSLQPPDLPRGPRGPKRGQCRCEQKQLELSCCLMCI